MAMSKKDFIALADTLRESNRIQHPIFNSDHLDVLAQFCKEQNRNFMRDRWLAYIAGTCGPNGGSPAKTGWAVQGNYGSGWETVCEEDSRKEALIRLREYRENETQYSHRLVRA